MGSTCNDPLRHMPNGTWLLKKVSRSHAVHVKGLESYLAPGDGGSLREIIHNVGPAGWFDRAVSSPLAAILACAFRFE